MYDLVIFDLDGTLIDSVGDIADTLNRLLVELGLAERSDAEVISLIGCGVDKLVERALPPDQRAGWPAAARRFRELYLASEMTRTGLYLGVKETLARLPMAKAVATNKPGALARRIVAELGIADAFEAVLGEDDVGRTKPDPLIVDLLRGKVGAPRARTLYVGDSLVDAETARAAGVDLALVTYGYADPARIRACPARFHLERFGDLLRVTSS